MYANNKHLALDQRNIIEQGLNEDLSLIQISKKINKDPRTISKEIRKHMIKKDRSFYNCKNTCTHILNCTVTSLCGNYCKQKCKTCGICNSKCQNYEPITCKRLTRFPYVCNACKKKSSCRLDKYYYKSLLAFKDCKSNLSSSREGTSLSELELANLNDILTSQILKGKSVAIIHKNLKTECSLSSLYNYIEKGYLTVRNIDLARKVKFRKRKKRSTPKDTKARINKTYNDFKTYLETHPETQVVEMDTVEGIKGGKVLLTLLLRNCKLMLAFLIEEKTTETVLEVFNMLEELLTYDVFCKIFEVILTNNGSEFSDPLSLEFNSEGIGRTRIFYCDPASAYQKGMLEKNHEFIRYVIPKGTSMDNLIQSQVDVMINNINNYNRESLNWNSPYMLAELILGKEILKKLNLSYIPFEEVKLIPNILKIK